MSDNMIIKSISKTYFIILSFLAFIFLTFTFIFIILQNGVQIRELSISNVQIKQLYIKWDEKIDVSIKEISIQSAKDKATPKLNYEFISKYLKALQHTTNWFNSIDIQKIQIDQTSASFEYKKDAKGFVIVESPTFLLRSALFYDQNILEVAIEKFYDREKDLFIQGDIYFDLDQLEAFSKLNITLNKDANLTLFSSINQNGMEYSVKSKNHIKDVKHIIKLASLPKAIKFWTYDAIEVKSLEIQSIKGSIDFNNINQAYKSVSIKAVAHNLDYMYNPQLDAVHTKTTDLEFQNGVLYIRPQNAFSYGASLGKSWLKIDFTKKEELLTLHLLFDAQLNKDMLTILNTYKIKLPFLQKKGLVSTDLIIVVNLMSIDVDAKGSFFTKKANFDYIGLNIDIFDTKILLDNYDVTINQMRAKYKDIAEADVKVKFNAKESKGNIDFKFKKIAYENISLNANSPQLEATYTISPKQDFIHVAKSSWNIDTYNLVVDALAIPFDLKSLDLQIPTTYVELTGISSALLAGKINLKSYKTDLSLDVLNLSYDGISFSQSNTPFHVAYSKNLLISSKEDIFFDISGTEYIVSKPSITIDAQSVSVKNAKVQIGRFASTKLYAKYNRKTAKTHVSLSDFKIKNYAQDKLLYANKKILLSIVDNNESLKVSSKELGATFTSNSDGWKVYINSLSQISDNSELLQQFHLEKGNFTLYKKRDNKYVHFKANLNYPYKILTTEGKPTDAYKIKGKLKNDKIFFTINNSTSVTLAKEVKIRTRNSGININEIIRLMKDTHSGTTEKPIDVKLRAIDSFLYLSDSRKIISELINLQYTNSILTAQLKYQQGEAGLRFQGDKFHLYGKDFNDKFMDKLFSLSKFKGGRLDFSMDGNVDDYSGVFYIKESTIMDYKILNNILAFINTVPSLITFSLPGYSINGLFIDQAYINFNSKESVFNLLDIYLKSKELTIIGKGSANIKKDTIDVTLNLKTDLGSNASKIPLVGYILFDKESMSTTLKIDGKLSNPNIESLLAKEIVVAPLNIIKRTLSLPYDLLKNLQPDSQ